MINKFIILLSIAIFATGCSNKIGVVKRKYNKGFFVNVSRQHKTEKIAQTNISKIKGEEPKPEEVTVQSVNETDIPVIPQVLPLKSPGQTQRSERNSPVTASAQNIQLDAAPQIKELPSAALNKKIKGSKGGDVNLIVMIILCLFPLICLIPIYLHDGKNFTLNFLVDLILHLTIIGEIIFALLVVLDVVDLA